MPFINSIKVKDDSKSFMSFDEIKLRPGWYTGYYEVSGDPSKHVLVVIDSRTIVAFWTGCGVPWMAGEEFAGYKFTPIGPGAKITFELGK